MSETHSNPALEREDLGEVTVLRAKVPMLRSDEATEAVFGQLGALVDEAGRSRLVLNLDGVVSIASAAIGKLVTLVRKVRLAGGRLTLCKLTRTMGEIMEMTHLAEIVPIYGDEQEAVRSFA
jgi:anti-sigma B factor antagonist